jgi:hypothetical protein
LTVLPVIASTDSTIDSLSPKTKIFWLIVAGISLVLIFILLSCLLCLKQTQPNQVYINNIESGNKEFNRKFKHKDYISKDINDWLKEQDSCYLNCYSNLSAYYDSNLWNASTIQSMTTRIRIWIKSRQKTESESDL